ncbi:MAG: hypothetical protein ACFNTC_05280, partial [Prevotella sp.]
MASRLIVSLAYWACYAVAIFGPFGATLPPVRLLMAAYFFLSPHSCTIRWYSFSSAGECCANQK